MSNLGHTHMADEGVLARTTKIRLYHAEPSTANAARGCQVVKHGCALQTKQWAIPNCKIDVPAPAMVERTYRQHRWQCKLEDHWVGFCWQLQYRVMGERHPHVVVGVLVGVSVLTTVCRVLRKSAALSLASRIML